MLTLHAGLDRCWDEEPFLVRLSGGREPPGESDVLLLRDVTAPPTEYRRLLSVGAAVISPKIAVDRLLTLPQEMDYLDHGDILRIVPRTGEARVLYRRAASVNGLLLTERCNSNCIMCSQPPKPGEDGHLLAVYLQAIPLMSQETKELGITGGEPTLLGPGLLQLIATCKSHLPRTSIHVLSNGRLFNYLSLSQAVAGIEHPDLMFGIPLYSDLPSRHDFVVQAAGAFDQTVRGIMNLKRCGVAVEIRVVLHRQTIDRLPQLARFLARNLPVVNHVALMGLENMGYVKMNLSALWIDPVEYGDALSAAVDELCRAGLRVSIYNHQLCLLPPHLWPFARMSISDWKNEYLDCCSECAVRERCGGFFASYKLKFSEYIRPISQTDLALGAESIGAPHHHHN